MKAKLNMEVFNMIKKRFDAGETMEHTAGPNQEDYMSSRYNYADGYRLNCKNKKITITDIEDPDFCLHVVPGDNLWFDNKGCK